MTEIVFTYAGLLREDGMYAVHLYLDQSTDWEGTPRGERVALDDAAHIIRDLVRENDVKNPERLLKDGAPPKDAVIICRNSIRLYYDRALRMARYKRGDYERLQWDSKWNPVAALMMELYDYTYGVLKKRERKEAGDCKRIFKERGRK